MGLAAGMQHLIHHGNWRLNHEHSDQQNGESRYTFHKLLFQDLEQRSLDGVALGIIVAPSCVQINALPRLMITLWADQPGYQPSGKAKHARAKDIAAPFLAVGLAPDLGHPARQANGQALA